MAAADGEAFTVGLVAVGEGGVACGDVSRGKDDGGMVDGMDGATMTSYISGLLYKQIWKGI